MLVRDAGDGVSHLVLIAAAMFGAEQTCRLGTLNLWALEQQISGTSMKALHSTALCLAIALGASACADRDPASDAGANRIAAELKAELARCEDFSGNARDVCVQDAQGHSKVATAELAQAGAPSDERRLAVAMARADAALAVARVRCDGQSGNARDVCLQVAEQEHAVAAAEAKLTMDVNEIRTIERADSAAVAATARDATDAAKDEAMDTKREADYAVAKEKCDAFAGDARSTCLESAHSTFASN